MRGRNYERVPELGKAKEFAITWREWYVGLQDPARGRWPLKRDKKEVYNWDKLNKGSRNGFGLVLVSLAWWRTVLRTEAEHKEFYGAIEEVSWTLQRMLSMGQVSEEGTKRQREEERKANEDDGKRKRYVVCRFTSLSPF